MPCCRAIAAPSLTRAEIAAGTLFDRCLWYNLAAFSKSKFGKRNKKAKKKCIKFFHLKNY